MEKIYSGKDMSINAAAGTGIYQFAFTQVHIPPWQVGGNQSAAVARALGNYTWYGWYRANGHTPVVFPGEEYTFTCAPKQTGSVAVSGTALCLSIEVVADNRNPDEPVPLHHTVYYAAAGALTTGASAPGDTSEAVIYPPKDLCAYFGGAIAHTKYQRLRMYDRATVKTVDCTTEGLIVWAPGELDAEYEWIINTDDSSDFHDVDAGMQTARMNVTDSTYWELNWMIIEDTPDDWNASRRPPKVVDAKFRATFSGHSGTTKGHVKDPAGTTKWPST